MTTINIDTDVQLEVTFTAVVGGALVDPPTVTLYLENPAGTQTTLVYPVGIVRESTGIYSSVVTGNASGPWNWKWQGSGGVNVTTIDGKFYVIPSIFISG